MINKILVSMFVLVGIGCVEEEKKVPLGAVPVGVASTNTSMTAPVSNAVSDSSTPVVDASKRTPPPDATVSPVKAADAIVLPATTVRVDAGPTCPAGALDAAHCIP